MIDTELPRGLCINCKFSDSCGYRKSSSKTTLFCEEFECNDSAVPNLNNETSKQYETNQEEHKDSSKQGICYNCDNQHGCSYKKDYGPVMFCNEYK
ncbi:MAG: hypothetical protein KAQ98_12470 [Bacteriovoracaceae bacterium]|nr:hypothetical protein [Bacteriovoracaceae bacterium]